MLEILPGAIGAQLHGAHCLVRGPWFAFTAISMISGLCGSYFCSAQPRAGGNRLRVIYK